MPPAPRYTDSNGYVSIEVPERKDIEVILRKDGFQTKRQILNLQADPNRTITVYLQRAIKSDTQSPSLPSTTNLPSPQRWKFMGSASTGESISVDTSSIYKSNGTIQFNYKIGSDLIAANADCDNNRWYVARYGRWYSPQSQPTQSMLNYVCES